MNDLISRSGLIELLTTLMEKEKGVTCMILEWVVRLIERFPAVEVKEVDE